MKARLLPLIIATVTIASLVSSFYLLNKKERARKDYESFLLKSAGNAVVPENKKEGEKSMDEPQMAALQDFLMTVDPQERRVPVERLHRAYRELMAGNAGRLKAANPLQWNIVASNMGGRTREVMYDPNSATGNKVWAGAVTGGLWYNNNIVSGLSTWVPVNDLWPSLSISSITYDPNNTQVFYVGTGEAFTARVIYRESSGIGAGIFKSTDGGESWQQLSSTLNWKFVTDIEVRNENGNSVVYAGVASGTYHGTQQSSPTDGLYRSTDGGQSWFQVMPLIPGTTKPYAVADIEITASNRLIIGSMANLDGEGGATILYSDQGIAGTWTIYDDYIDIIQNDPEYYIPNRVMIGSAASDANVVYALLDAGYINSSNGFVYTRGQHIIKSTDGGASWTAKPRPSGGDYYWATIGWHALTLEVDPNNSESLYIGGLDVYKSTTGGNSWIQVSDWRYMYYGGGDEYVHADIHDIDFKPGSSDELLVTSDGGVFYTAEAGATDPPFQEKNLGFGSLQFYTCAIHPNAGSNRYVGGLQDNGTLYHTGTALTINNMIDGGDGAYCFIDDNEPQYMITSYYYNQYTLFLNGQYYQPMNNWSSGTFVSPADYDYRNNTLYANACSFGGTQANQLLRLKGIPNNISGNFINLNTGLNVYFSAVEWSPNSPDGTATIYAGSLNGRLFRVNNAQATPQVTEITGPDFPLGAISSVAIGGTDDTLLVTFSNYGVSSVWQTYDAGGTWEAKEANLPDMPVRWALYHPTSANYAMLATELGIWTTANLNEAETFWSQEIEGLANVRVDMLQIREADFTVLAATHGRGLATATWDIQTGVAGSDTDSDPDLVLFPNPTSGLLKVQSSRLNEGNVRIELLNMNGQPVMVLFDGSYGSDEMNLDISRQTPGAYLLKLTSGQSTCTRQVILKR